MKKRYPVKQDLNLAQRERSREEIRTAILTALALAAGIALFCAFAVVGRLNAVREAEQAAAQSEQLLAQARTATSGYNDLLEEYRRYTLAREALGTGADPMACLDLVEGELIQKSMVSGFAVSGDIISVQLAGVTLEEVSAIYTSLIKNGLVDGVQVYTAATGENTGDRVEAAMTIRLTLPEEKEVTAP